MLLAPITGYCNLEDNVPSLTSGPIGVQVTANSSIHTKTTTPTELIASTAYDAFGITIAMNGVGTVATTNARMLVDIMIGAASSEIVLIPDLMCGNTPLWSDASGGGAMYFFPIFIPKGSRLSSRAQALISSDTVVVGVYLSQWPIGNPDWIGSRVTAYGINAATSSGVSHSPGLNSYAAATQIISSTTNKVRALQIGTDLGTDTTAANGVGLVRIGLGATPNYFVSDLIFRESTTLETVDFTPANFLLSNMRFNFPAASDLRISAMRNISAEARGWALYGVD